jgi:hypothetical protein
LLDSGLEPGDVNVTGTGSPGCGTVQICLIGGPVKNMPSVPPCTDPDQLIGTDVVQPNGEFDVMLLAPLELNDCVYATCGGLVGPVQCLIPPAPAPALSPRALTLGVGVLGLVALSALRRRRSDASRL